MAGNVAGSNTRNAMFEIWQGWGSDTVSAGRIRDCTRLERGGEDQRVVIDGDNDDEFVTLANS